MKSFLLSDNRDTYLGLKLAGIDGIYIENKEKTLDYFQKALKDGYGIILLTEKIYSHIKNEVITAKTNLTIPLISVIPDRYGYHEDRDKITDYIKESIGL